MAVLWVLGGSDARDRHPVSHTPVLARLALSSSYSSSSSFSRAAMMTFGAIVRSRYRRGSRSLEEHVIKFRHELREQTSFEDEDDDEYEDEVPDGIC